MMGGASTQWEDESAEYRAKGGGHGGNMGMHDAHNGRRECMVKREQREGDHMVEEDQTRGGCMIDNEEKIGKLTMGGVGVCAFYHNCDLN